MDKVKSALELMERTLEDYKKVDYINFSEESPSEVSFIKLKDGKLIPFNEIEGGRIIFYEDFAGNNQVNEVIAKVNEEIKENEAKGLSMLNTPSPIKQGNSVVGYKVKMKNGETVAFPGKSR